MKVCLLEDDLTLGRSLQAALQDAGHEVVWLRRIADARYWLDEDLFDALLLDLGLPDGNGLDLLRSLRSRNSPLPVLLITARDAIEDRLNGLDLGADDYLIKPFENAELLARMRAVVRRGKHGGADTHIWKSRDLLIDDQRMLVTRGTQTIALSKTEFSLLLTLMKYPDRVMTRRELEARALPGSEGQALDVHMSNLRKKVGEGYIRTVRGVGYGLAA